MLYDIIIIGGGPAGLTAAIYARRAGKTVLVLEKDALGGQITWSPKVENYPAIPSISGLELGNLMAEQAMDQGAEVEIEEVVGIEDRGSVKRLRCAFGAEYEGKTVIIATGAKPRMLGLDREEELVGSGVGYCAVCDGAFFQGQPVAVNGGGNSALQDALLLSETCSRVYLIHRRDRFRGEEKLVEALRERENVEFVLNASVRELLGGDELSGIVVEQNGAQRSIAVSGLFVAIGHEPDNSAFADLITLDQSGYAEAGESCLTKTEGVFVAGDCRSKQVRQVATAAADGAVAALAACAWLDREA
ncbi:MAG: FAD-dependent oxidoreductase [Oscillospiraceae bacterium]|nr:FAD-dependent oxidoreductase [Oscillospiraceae bacterium]